MAARSLLYGISGFLNIAGGLVTLVTGVIMFISRLHGIETSKALAVVSLVIMILYSLSNIVVSLSSLTGKIRHSKLQKLARYLIINLLLCVIGIICSAINGISVAHLIIVLAAGIIVPLISYIAVKTNL
ncbi:MAG: hypothetical protein HUJ75_08820 [Parasporobacterium sp.]|nr:hypothetical protein [Parasporobacterium sp.]